MANPKVKFKRSSVANKRPTLVNLELGELALNTYDGKLFTKQDTGGVGIATTVTLVNPWNERYGGGGITYTGLVTATSFYGDGSNLTGVASSAVSISTSAPSSPSVGDLWFDPDYGRSVLYYNDGNTSQWIDHSPVNTTISEASDLTVTNGLYVTGIVTATGGFNLGISSAGTTITSGPITTLNFVGTGNTFALNGTTVDVSISGGGGASVSISTVAPTSPSAGDLWFNENYGRTLIYYDDGSSQQWIDASPVATTISSATNLQVTGVCTATTFDGNLELDQAAVESVTSTKTSTSEDSVDSFAAATYRSVTYDIQITRGSSYHTTTIKVLHDGTDTYMTEYGTMNTGSSLATFSSDISGGNVRLLATPSSATSTVFKIVKTLIKV